MCLTYVTMKTCARYIFFCRVISIGLDSAVDTAIFGELASSSSGYVFLQDISQLTSSNVIDAVAEAILDKMTVLTAPTGPPLPATSRNIVWQSFWAVFISEICLIDFFLSSLVSML